MSDAASARRVALSGGVLCCLMAGALLAAGSVPRAADVPTATTERAGAAATRGALPLRARPRSGQPAPIVAPHSLGFAARMLDRAPLGEFSHVAPALALAPTVDAAAADADATERPFVIMIDPGHGGSDPGAMAFNGLLEKELTRDIAERVSLFLSEIDGMQVKMTRRGDEGLSRDQRVRRVRDSEADLVLSLHFNHLPQQEITLVESFYAGVENIAESLTVQRRAELTPTAATDDIDTGFTQGSARLARLVQDRVYGEVARQNSGALDAGVKRDTLFVLTRSFVPGALIELTCLSNPAEAERLADEGYRNALAAALADAVRDYRHSLQEHPLGELEA